MNYCRFAFADSYALFWANVQTTIIEGIVMICVQTTLEQYVCVNDTLTSQSSKAILYYIIVNW